MTLIAFSAGFARAGFLRAPTVAPPTAFDDIAVCEFDNHVDTTVTANDTAGTSPIDTSTVLIESAPGHGTATVQGSGVIRYAPEVGFSGSDNYAYSVADTIGLRSDPAVVLVTVREAHVNPSGPTANGDSASCTFNGFVDISVLDNDVAGTNALAPSSTTVVAAPGHGSIIPQTPGVLRYVPVIGFSGSDSFTYTVADTSGIVSNAALVSVVTVAGTAPTAAADAATCAFNAFVDIDVLANDSAGTDAIDATTRAIVASPSHGALSLLSAGVVRYTSTTGYSGADTFTYQVSDAVGRVSNTALVSVTVTPDIAPIPDPPTAVADTASCPFNGHVDTTVTANDIAGTNPIDTSTVVIATAAVKGTAVFTGSGVVRFTATTGLTGADSYTYTVADNSGHRSTPALVSVTIAPAPIPPTAVADSATCPFNSHIDTTVTGNDTAHTNAIDTATVVIGVAPAHGTCSVLGSGVVRYTSSLNYSGPDSYTYTVKDTAGLVSNAALVSVTVQAGVPTVYSNGYLKRSRFRVPAALLQAATLTNAIFVYDRTVADLKTVANGGVVTSPTADDVRFELIDGTKLKHRIPTGGYTATTGRLRAYVLVPSVPAGVDLSIFIYAGLSGAVEPDAAGLYANLISAHNCLTGADMSGGGHSLSMSGVTAGSSFLDSGQYAAGRRGELLITAVADPFVVVAPTLGLTRTEANLLTPTSPNLTGSNTMSVAAGKTMDLRDLTFTGGTVNDANMPVRIRTGSSGDMACFIGAKVVGLHPRTVTWRQNKHDMFNSDHGEPGWTNSTGDFSNFVGLFNETGSGNTIVVENFAMYNLHDSLRLNGATAYKLIVRGCYIEYNRDDAIENDGIKRLEVYDTLCVGSHTFISQRPSSGGSTTLVVPIYNSLIRMNLQPYATDVGGTDTASGAKYDAPWPNGQLITTPPLDRYGWVCNEAFKLTAGGASMNVDMKDSIIAIEGVTGAPWIWPAGTYSNVLFLWLGSGSIPSDVTPVPSGVTVSTDPTIWNAKASLWITAHGGTPTVDANGVPFCSDFPFLHK